jgi:hypothetical protein
LVFPTMQHPHPLYLLIFHSSKLASNITFIMVGSIIFSQDNKSPPLLPFLCPHPLPVPSPA